MEGNNKHWRSRLCAYLYDALIGITVFGALMVDVLEAFNWWRALLVAGGLSILNYRIWWDPVLNERLWKLVKNEKTRRSVYQCVYGLIFCVVIFFWAHSIGARSVSAIENPEDPRNKVVDVYQIDPPWKGYGTHGLLVEFGVTTIKTEGLIVEIQFDREFIKVDNYPRLGAPGFRGEPPETNGYDPYQGIPEILGGENIFRLPVQSLSVTRHTSIYYYFEANSDIEPLDILYFALPGSAADSGGK